MIVLLRFAARGVDCAEVVALEGLGDEGDVGEGGEGAEEAMMASVNVRLKLYVRQLSVCTEDGGTSRK